MANEAISTNNTWPNYSAANKATTSAASQELGKDQFLKILITQLQNQDPMQPMEDKEFIAQMAQFSSVEQLVNISSQLTTLTQSLGAVSSMIGREISWISTDTSSSDGLSWSADDEDSNSTVRQGIVESIIVRDGVQYAKVGSAEIPLNEIIQVADPTTADETSADETPENAESSEEAVSGGNAS